MPRPGAASLPSSPRDAFDAAVREVVKRISPGRTRSYAQVALYAGRAGAARQVAKALRRLADVPWWRVIRADGTIAPQMMPEQAERLLTEGAEVRGRRVIPKEPGRLPAAVQPTRASSLARRKG